PIVGMTGRSDRHKIMQRLCSSREGLQWKAHSEARARTCNEKPDPQGHTQISKKRAKSKDEGTCRLQTTNFKSIKEALTAIAFTDK
ncbi:MAG: hypothetical protein ACRYGB_02690, partial [Janthinobacterium lividum]